MAHTEQLEGEAALDTSSVSGLAAFTPEQQLALTRFARFDILRRRELPALESNDWRARLILKALSSAYRDCEAAGVAEEARLFGARAD